MKPIILFATLLLTLSAVARASLVGSITVTSPDGSDTINTIPGDIRCPSSSPICTGAVGSSIDVGADQYGIAIGGVDGASFGVSLLSFSGFTFADGRDELYTYTLSYAGVNGFSPGDVLLAADVITIDLTGVVFAGGAIDIFPVEVPEPSPTGYASAALLAIFAIKHFRPKTFDNEV